MPEPGKDALAVGKRARDGAIAKVSSLGKNVSLVACSCIEESQPWAPVVRGRVAGSDVVDVELCCLCRVPIHHYHHHYDPLLLFLDLLLHHKHKPNTNKLASMSSFSAFSSPLRGAS